MSNSIRELCACSALCLCLDATAAATAPPPVAGRAASQPASAPVMTANAAKGRLEVHIRHGAKKPGASAPAKLEIAGTSLNLDVAAGAVGKFDAVSKGKASLKVFVPGAEKCILAVDVAGGKTTIVKVFVPKRGLGLECERVTE